VFSWHARMHADLSILLRSITDSAGLFINWLNNVVAERAYSRKLEMEADVVGLNVSQKAGRRSAFAEFDD